MKQNQPETNPPPAPGKKQNTAMAIVAYILFFIPLLTDAKNDPFVKFHVKQGLLLFLSCLVVWVISAVLPFYVWWKIYWIFHLGLLALFIIGVINAAGGKEKELPLIGKLASKFKF